MSSASFYLRGIDLGDLVQKYLSGSYLTLSTQLSVVVNEVALAPVLSATSKSTLTAKSHEFYNESGRSFVTVGYRLKNGAKYGEVSQGEPGRCMYCLDKLDPQYAMGIPIAKEVKSGVVIYHCIDIFCWFPCILAELRKRLSGRNNLYSYSMTYLTSMYEEVTGEPFTNLNPAPDNRLLKIFNGDMDYPEFHEESFRYSTKPENIYFFPIISTLEKDV